MSDALRNAASADDSECRLRPLKVCASADFAIPFTFTIAVPPTTSTFDWDSRKQVFHAIASNIHFLLVPTSQRQERERGLNKLDCAGKC
jgi:hypothetical protein